MAFKTQRMISDMLCWKQKLILNNRNQAQMLKKKKIEKVYHFILNGFS